MSAIVLSFCNQKGGVGKSTSAAICSYLLSTNYEYETLLVDMDPQSNASRMVRATEGGDKGYQGSSILEALVHRNAGDYIYWLKERLYLLPAHRSLSLFEDYLRDEVSVDKQAFVLKETLQNVKKQFDFIVIDCPPNLRAGLINSLTASDAVVVMFEPSQFCYDALEIFFDSLEDIQATTNPNLRVAGILPAMVDNRRSDVKAFIEAAKQSYGEYLFKSQVKRRASTGRLAVDGIIRNPELVSAVEPYEKFMHELVERLEKAGMLYVK